MSTDRFIGFDAKGNHVPIAALVEHPDRETMRICAAPGYELALFHFPGKPLEVIVTGGDDTWRLAVRAPTEIETLTISYPETRTIEFKYGDVFSVKR